MLTSLNALVGLPAVWQNQQVGWIERAVADVEGRRLGGLVVRKGMGGARWAHGGEVLSADENFVLLRSKPVRFGGMPQEKSVQTFLTTGEAVGVVTDVFFRTDRFDLAALEVCRGPVQRLLGFRAYAVDFCIRPGEIQDEVVAAQLLSWTQLLSHLGEEGEP